MTIVAFSGRLKSGKTTLAQPFINNGYIKVSFADILKESLASIYGLDFVWFTDQTLKNKKTKFIYDEKIAIKLCKYFNLDIFKVWKESDYKELESIRDMMQYVGTDILRRYDYDFHVNKTIEKLDVENNNYIFDDVRFYNEFSALKELNAYNIFVIRPWFFEYSNHASEINLNYHLFDSVIINDSSKEDFDNKAQEIFKSIIDGTFISVREKYSHKDQVLEVNIRVSEAYNHNYFLPILDHMFISKDKIEIGGCYFSKLFSKSFKVDEHITNPYFIENLKLFNIQLFDNGYFTYDYPLLPKFAIPRKSYLKGLLDYTEDMNVKTKDLVLKVPTSVRNKKQVLEAIKEEFETLNLQIVNDDTLIVSKEHESQFLQYVL